ncbi:MAG TPA: molybdopterin-binding protein [Anaerolineales bacterium]|nr:molybdopterin-binding protein [Anaerolineales bacterium]
MPTAEIITIGTEILLGEIVDTNTRHIAVTLRDLGVDLYRTVTIGDNVDRIATAIRESAGRNDIVITTGGLGPTVDDPTRQAVAKALALESEFREELWQQVVSAIARYGRKPEENQRRQAVVPRGAIAISNPVGTAPAFIVETQRSVVISLPGVPHEMEHILHESVIPYLQKRFSLRERIKVRILHCSGLGEGTIDEKIGDLELLANPTVGLAAHTGIVDVRIAAKAETEERAAELIAGVERQVRERLGTAVFGADEDRLEQVALAAAAKRGWSVVAVEYGLHGLLASRLPRVLAPGDAPPSDLQAAAERTRRETGCDVTIVVAINEADRTVGMCLATPLAITSRTLRYGGPPRSLARWATNLALNWLRVTAEGSG